MPIPTIVWAAVLVQGLPAAFILTRRNRSRPVLLIALALLFSLLGDVVGHEIGRRTGNSLWLSSLSGGVITALYLFALADWQRTDVERVAVRIAVLPFLAGYFALLFFLDGMDGFPRYSYPFSAVVVLGMSLWTLLRNALQVPGMVLFERDWFLILVGLALNTATTMVSSPIAAVLLAHHRYELISQVWSLRACFVLAAISLVAVGTLLPPSEEVR